MGCGQSSDADEPGNNPTLMRNSSGIMNQSGVMNNSGIHSAESFEIMMIGNSATHGLVLGFSG